jgi:hypothetical protein
MELYKSELYKSELGDLVPLQAQEALITGATNGAGEPDQGWTTRRAYSRGD